MVLFISVVREPPTTKVTIVFGVVVCALPETFPNRRCLISVTFRSTFQISFTDVV